MQLSSIMKLPVIVNQSIQLNSEPNGDDENQSGIQTLTRPETKTGTPAMYKVIILNDDFTPRDFVIHILKKFFRKNESDATQLMLEVHHKGSGIAGVYAFEIAETKAFQVNEYSKQNRHPLKTVIERG